MKDGGALKKMYDRLSSFERACLLLKEATGRRREAKAKALAPFDLNGAFWQQYWHGAFIKLAMYAVTRALLCQVHAGNCRAVGDCGGELEAAQRAAGWLGALRAVEAESGAPLLEVLSMFGLDGWAAEFEQEAGLEVDATKQLAALRKLWTLQANAEDRWRGQGLKLAEIEELEADEGTGRLADALLAMEYTGKSLRECAGKEPTLQQEFAAADFSRLTQEEKLLLLRVVLVAERGQITEESLRREAMHLIGKTFFTLTAEEEDEIRRTVEAGRQRVEKLRAEHEQEEAELQEEAEQEIREAQGRYPWL